LSLEVFLKEHEVALEETSEKLSEIRKAEYRQAQEEHVHTVFVPQKNGTMHQKIGVVPEKVQSARIPSFVPESQKTIRSFAAAPVPSEILNGSLRTRIGILTLSFAVATTALAAPFNPMVVSALTEVRAQIDGVSEKTRTATRGVLNTFANQIDDARTYIVEERKHAEQITLVAHDVRFFSYVAFSSSPILTLSYKEETEAHIYDEREALGFRVFPKKDNLLLSLSGVEKEISFDGVIGFAQKNVPVFVHSLLRPEELPEKVWALLVQSHQSLGYTLLNIENKIVDEYVARIHSLGSASLLTAAHVRDRAPKLAEESFAALQSVPENIVSSYQNSVYAFVDWAPAALFRYTLAVSTLGDLFLDGGSLLANTSLEAHTQFISFAVTAPQKTLEMHEHFVYGLGGGIAQLLPQSSYVAQVAVSAEDFSEDENMLLALGEQVERARHSFFGYTEKVASSVLAESSDFLIQTQRAVPFAQNA
jgi:hypothetical protein